MLAHLKIIWQFHQKVSRFFEPRYIGDDIFLGPNLVSLNRTLVPYEISRVNFRVETQILVSMSEEVSLVSDVRERVRDLGSTLRCMLRRSSSVECVSVLHGTCLQCAEFFFIHQYVQPCLSKNPKYTFYTIKSSLTLAYN